MCGDGTNDVGALKHANVGVALITNAPLTLPEPPKITFKRIQEAFNNGAMRNKIIRRQNEKLNAAKLAAQTGKSDKAHETQRNIQRMLQEIEEHDIAQVVKLGDASIAAPFTSKLSSIQCGKCSGGVFNVIN